MNIKKDKKTVMHKVLSILSIILCAILVPVLIVNIILIVKSHTNPNEVPSFGNSVPMVVLTDSMYPTIESGDLIILEKTEAEQVKKGDIITFFDPKGDGSSTITHRVNDVIFEDGKILFQTKGDANNVADKELILSDNLIGVYNKRIPGIGNIIMFMANSKTLIICVAILLVILVGYDFIDNKNKDKQSKEENDALRKELEKLKKAQNKA